MSTLPPLTAVHQQQLAASAIAESIIAARGYQSIAPGAIEAVRALHGWGGEASKSPMLKQILHDGALAFPIYHLGSPTPYTWVLRPDTPRLGRNDKPIKYEWRQDTPNVFDVLPCYHDALGDPSIPIWLTEGAKKADALASAFGGAIVPVNLNGVYGWRTRTPAGGRIAAPDFECIAWNGRRVIVAPDGDVRENRDVLNAIQRLVRLLASRTGSASIEVCYLPQPRGGAKLGVDDYLAAGHDPASLEEYLLPSDRAASGARLSFSTHPTTAEKLYLPAGYDVRNQSIYRVDDRGTATKIYSGAIFVTATGEDLHTHEHTDTICWNGRGTQHGELTIPHAALSDTRAFSTLIGNAGAALGPQTIKHVQQFLVEFVQENRDAIPHEAHVNRLGLVDTSFITPAGGIGFAEPVRYIGSPRIHVGTDAAAYPAAIRAMLTWPDAGAAWLVLGLSLAAPAVARLRLRRNPVLYLSGASGSGKTTLAQFATGCWGDPTRQPLRVESGRTTQAGFYQTLEQLGGLPLLIDEAHTVPDPKRLEMTCYSFANGQTYSKGGADGTARGGAPLAGVLLLAGEALPDFKHAGSRLRVLWVDAGAALPLGAEARSETGRARAQILEAAWDQGAGLLGHAIASVMWQDWPRFAAQVRTIATDAALAPLGPWCEPLAAAAAALELTFRHLGLLDQVPGGAAWIHTLLDTWAAMLTAGHAETDPATDAWEALVTMLAQGHRRDDRDSDVIHNAPIGNAEWEYIEADRGGGVIACRKPGEAIWRVLPTTPQFQDRIGASAVQLYGRTWVKRGWVHPSPDGKTATTTRIYPAGTVRALMVPDAALTDWTIPPA